MKLKELLSGIPVLSATADMVGFESCRRYYQHPDKIVVTGTPVRGDFFALTRQEAKAKLGVDDGRPLIVSFWGSLGASGMAISSPLLETSIEGAKGVLINVTGSMDIGLEEVEQAASLVQQAVHPDALTIFGATFDEALDDEIRVTVIATGFDKEPVPQKAPGAPLLREESAAAKETRPAGEPAAAPEPTPLSM